MSWLSWIECSSERCLVRFPCIAVPTPRSSNPTSREIARLFFYYQTHFCSVCHVCAAMTCDSRGRCEICLLPRSRAWSRLVFGTPCAKGDCELLFVGHRKLRLERSLGRFSFTAILAPKPSDSNSREAAGSISIPRPNPHLFCV